MSFLSVFKKNRQPVYILVDIGSSSVSVCAACPEHACGKLVKPVEGLVSRVGTLQVLAAERRQITFGQGFNFKKFLADISSGLKETLRAVKKQVPVVPDKIFCFLSSPFYISRTKIIKYVPDKDFVFTKALLQDITGREAESFIKQEPPEHPEVLDDRQIVIENKVMQVRLNGYEVKSPFEKRASVAQLCQYLSIGSEKTLLYLKDILQAETQGAMVEFHSFAFAAYDALRELDARVGSFLVVDVSGELSDIALVRDGILAENLSFPFGNRTLIKATAEKFNSFSYESETLMRMGRTGLASTAAVAKLNEALTAGREAWLEAFRQALSQMTASTILPDTVYLIGEDGNTKCFADWLAEADLSGHTYSKNSFTVKLADNKLFGLPKDTTGKLLDDIFQVVELQYCDKMLASNKN